MTYGPEVHGTEVTYEVRVTHTPSQNLIEFTAIVKNAINPTIPEQQQDNLFQIFLTKLSEMGNVDILAIKHGSYTTSVTP